MHAAVLQYSRMIRTKIRIKDQGQDPLQTLPNAHASAPLSVGFAALQYSKMRLCSRIRNHDQSDQRSGLMIKDQDPLQTLPMPLPLSLSVGFSGTHGMLLCNISGS